MSVWLPRVIKSLELIANSHTATKRLEAQLHDPIVQLQLEKHRHKEMKEALDLYTETLSRLGSYDLQPILAGLENPTALVREVVAVSLERNENQDRKMALPLLEKMLSDPIPDVQRAARHALDKLKE